MRTCCRKLGLKVNSSELREVFAKLVLQRDEPLRVVTRNIIEQCWKSEPITLHAESSGRLERCWNRHHPGIQSVEARSPNLLRDEPQVARHLRFWEVLRNPMPVMPAKLH